MNLRKGIMSLAKRQLSRVQPNQKAQLSKDALAAIEHRNKPILEARSKVQKEFNRIKKSTDKLKRHRLKMKKRSRRINRT